MRKYFYTKFYMCSPVVHKRAADPTVVSLGNARRCYRHRLVRISIDYVLVTVTATATSNGVPVTSLWLSTFNCVTLQILKSFQKLLYVA